eukprot:IDg13028t1
MWRVGSHRVGGSPTECARESIAYVSPRAKHPACVYRDWCTFCCPLHARQRQASPLKSTPPPPHPISSKPTASPFRTRIPPARTMFSRTTQAVLAVLLLAGAAQASLHCSETSLRVLQSYGSGQATLSCTLSTKPNERYLSANLQGYRRKIITSISFSPVSGSSVLNITAHLDLDGKLGYTAFKLAVQTTQRVLYTPASCDVRGVQAHVPVLRRWRPIPPSARVVLYSGRGEAPARLSDCKLSATNKQLVVTATNNNRLIVRGDRRAPREAKVLIDCPAISLDGETAETDLRMRVRRARNRGALRIAARSAR